MSAGAGVDDGIAVGIGVRADVGVGVAGGEMIIEGAGRGPALVDSIDVA